MAEGCPKLGKKNHKRQDGTYSYKKYCSRHLNSKCSGDTLSEVSPTIAASPSIQSMKVPKLHRYKKLYCENRDGRLGYKCNSEIQLFSQLEIDHINGNPYDNIASNFQTLCCNCHRYKTIIYKDHISPGRKK